MLPQQLKKNDPQNICFRNSEIHRERDTATRTTMVGKKIHVTRAFYARLMKFPNSV